MASSASALAPAAMRPFQLDLQREVDVMQSVYTQERRQLEGLLRQLEEEARQVVRSAPQEEEEAPAACAASAVPLARRVRWRLQEGALAHHWAHREAGLGHGVRTAFDLPECPGARLCLALGPAEATGDAALGGADGAGAPPPRYRLALEVSGEGAAGFLLGASLWLEVDGEGLPPASAELLGASELVCEGAWPAAWLSGGPPAGAVLTCCAELEPRGHEPPALQLESAWPGAGGAAEEAPGQWVLQRGGGGAEGALG
ncbi:unnamed protein product [Prorocentrum cordatum]|uniref:Beta-galactosidase n=1 Tax=Prorocentrum cordatum TaxID=2364126 RepID=A0ABN9WML9_9DINO|nr:unnamed protein product [Polarella glacialis]